MKSPKCMILLALLIAGKHCSIYIFNINQLILIPNEFLFYSAPALSRRHSRKLSHHQNIESSRPSIEGFGNEYDVVELESTPASETVSLSPIQRLGLYGDYDEYYWRNVDGSSPSTLEPESTPPTPPVVYEPSASETVSLPSSLEKYGDEMSPLTIEFESTMTSPVESATASTTIKHEERSSTVAPDDERVSCNFLPRLKCIYRCGIYPVKDCYQIKTTKVYVCRCRRSEVEETEIMRSTCYLFNC